MAGSNVAFAGAQQAPRSDGWSHRRASPRRFVSPDFLDLVVEKHQTLRGLWSGHRAARTGHELLADELYPERLLACLRALHEHAAKSGDDDTVEGVSAAVLDLWSALELLDSDGRAAGARPRAVFAAMRAASWLGDPAYHWLVERLAKARRAGAACLRLHAAAVPPGTFLLVDGRAVLFAEAAADAVQEQHEAEHGLDLGQGFADRLNDPSVTCVVVSLDIGSTLQTEGAYASPALLEKLGTQMEILTERFAERFPDKTLALVLCTDEPAPYLWGVQEMLAPLSELRLLGVAESGAVMTWREGARHEVRSTDAGRTAINKYSGLIAGLRRRGLIHGPRDALICHVGGADSDVLPEHATGEGEPNEGAREAFFVAVAGGSDELRRAAGRRCGRGTVAARRSILAVHDVLRGISAVVEASPPSSGVRVRRTSHAARRRPPVPT